MISLGYHKLIIKSWRDLMDDAMEKNARVIRRMIANEAEGYGSEKLGRER